MTDETKMDEMNIIYLELRNAIYHCEEVLERSDERALLSLIEQGMFNVGFDAMKSLIEISQRC